MMTALENEALFLSTLSFHKTVVSLAVVVSPAGSEKLNVSQIDQAWAQMKIQLLPLSFSPCCYENDRTDFQKRLQGCFYYCAI